MKRWLYFLLLVLLGPLWGLEKTELKDEPITLDPMLVRGTAQSSFGIDLRIYVDPETRFVKAIFITHVNDDSDAADCDLQVGDEIVELDGIPVNKMSGQVNKDSELGRLLLNRRVGASLKLGLVAKRPRDITMHWPWPPGKVFVRVQKTTAVSMVVDRVAGSPDTGGPDLRPGDEIVRINRLDFHDLAPNTDVYRQIDDLFSNLPREDIRLKVITTSVNQVTLRAFFRSRFESERPAWH